MATLRTLPDKDINDDEIPLSEASAEAARVYGVTPRSGSYRRLQAMVSDGQLEVIRRGGRIYVRRSTLPVVGSALGLTAPAHAA